MKSDVSSCDENISTEKEAAFGSMTPLLIALLIVARRLEVALWIILLPDNFVGAGKSTPSNGQLWNDRA